MSDTKLRAGIEELLTTGYLGRLKAKKRLTRDEGQLFVYLTGLLTADEPEEGTETLTEGDHVILTLAVERIRRRSEEASRRLAGRKSGGTRRGHADIAGRGHAPRYVEPEE